MTDEDDWLEGLAREARGELSPGDEPVPGTPEVAPEVVADQVTADVAKRLPELQALQTQLAQLHTPALDDVAREGAARLAEDNQALIANAQEPQAKALSAESTLATRPPPAALTEQQAMSPPPAAAAVKEEAEAQKGPPPIVEQAKGLEQKALPTAVPPPAKTQGAAAEDDYAMQMPEMYTAPPRKKTGVLDDEGAMWAALLDVFVNRGRGTPQILQRAGELADKRRNDQLDEDYRVAQINSLNRRGIVDPETKQLQKIRLMQSAARLQMQAEHDKLTAAEYKRRMDETKAKYGAGSPQVQEVIAHYKGLGVPDNVLAAVGDMSMDTVKAIMPTLRQQADIAQAPQLAQAAGTETAARTGAKLDVEHAYAPQTTADAANRAAQVFAATIPFQREKATEVAAGTQAGQGDYRERRLRYEKARAYMKDNEHELAIGGLINEIDQLGGAKPEQLAERLRGVLGGYGIDTPERLEAWQAKQMVLEIWARKQTGAAISATEGERFDIQTGMKAGASPAQVEAAYAVMNRLVQRQLRASATENETAPDILLNAGVTDDPYAYLGKTQKEATASAKQPVPPTAYGSPTKQTAYAQPPPEAAPAAPGQIDLTVATPTLPVTQGKVPKAPIKRGPAQPPPAAAPAAKQPYTIDYGNGKVETLPLTPQEAAAVAKKYKVTPGAAPPPPPQRLQLEY